MCDKDQTMSVVIRVLLDRAFQVENICGVDVTKWMQFIFNVWANENLRYIELVFIEYLMGYSRPLSVVCRKHLFGRNVHGRDSRETILIVFLSHKWWRGQIGKLDRQKCGGKWRQVSGYRLQVLRHGRKESEVSGVGDYLSASAVWNGSAWSSQHFGERDGKWKNLQQLEGTVGSLVLWKNIAAGNVNAIRGLFSSQYQLVICASACSWICISTLSSLSLDVDAGNDDYNNVAVVSEVKFMGNAMSFTEDLKKFSSNYIAMPLSANKRKNSSL